MASGQISPSIAMQNQLTKIDGQIHPITLLGRWIARAQGADDAEMKREAKQRRIQDERAGLYAPGGDHDGDGLLDYRQLYALWERQNWRATELDFSVDREQWVVTPREAQESTIWSLGSFYVGEERVTADLAPFLQAAPTGEIELFLATQLVDEARHAAFFDRFGAEVMCLSADDFRGRMREVEQILLSPWREVFDDGLRDVARRIQAKPDDLDLFVEGIATYHMVVEGFLAVTGQTLIRDYMLEHSLYPGFCEGFGLVERDEHRHVAFGVRFLRDAIREDPRHRDDRGARCARAGAQGGVRVRAAVRDGRPRVRLVRVHLAPDLRLRLPDAAAAHEGARHRDPAGRGVHAGADRRHHGVRGRARPPGRRAPLTAHRRTAQAISRRRPRASRPERGSGEEQAEPDRRERERLPPGPGEAARGPAANARLGGR